MIDDKAENGGLKTFHIVVMVATFLVITTYQFLGVPCIKDPVRLIYKKDSNLANAIIEKTRLRSLVFTTTLGGTFPNVQSVIMLIIEAYYHAVYPAIPLHRDVFHYSDGGQSAMDWAYAVPQRTRHMTKEFKDRLS